MAEHRCLSPAALVLALITTAILGPAGCAGSRHAAAQAQAHDGTEGTHGKGEARHTTDPPTGTLSAPAEEPHGELPDGGSDDDARAEGPAYRADPLDEAAADVAHEAEAAAPFAAAPAKSMPAGSSRSRGGAAGAPAKKAERRHEAGAAVSHEASVPAAWSQAPAVRAGRHDDNKQYNRFLAFLRDNARLIPYPIDITERLVLRAVDQDGKSLHNCQVRISAPGGEQLAETTTYADGSTQFFPAAVGKPSAVDYVAVARCGDASRRGQLQRRGRRETALRFDLRRKVPARVAVDIAVVLDTTGSMGGQIERLKKTLRAIHFQLSQLESRPDIRFALVAYRDQGDDYVTRVSPFTGDVQAFAQILEGVDADGGGDTPEDLQAALDKALHELHWRSDGLRLGFIVADAPAHTDYGQDFTYAKAMQESLQRGIKWTAVGAGGLGLDGEIVFRQIAQLTMGEYVFVTEGGPPRDSGATATEASHHVGSNYRTENLDQAIVRIVRRELSYLTDEPKDFDDTIVATAEPGVKPQTVLNPAVEEVIRQLVDYSSLRLEKGTAVAVLPVVVKEKEHGDAAEYVTDRLVLCASRHPMLRVLERDLRAVAQEIKLQLSDLFDVEKTVAIGEMVGAEALVVTKLTARGDRGELFAKLVRVQTGEVLSVANVELPAHLLGDV